ncbi:unnamed protein product [Calypogeia fissa]
MGSNSAKSNSSGNNATLKGFTYADRDKLDGLKNYISWAFKVERQFRKEKVWLELVCPNPLNPITLTPEQLAEKEKDELIQVANHTLNRCDTSSLKDSTPYQSLYGSKPDFTHLRVVGCLAYVHIPKEMCHKLSAKSIRTTLVGYDETSKAYCCYDPIKRKILISCDVIFNENAKLADSTSSQNSSLLGSPLTVATQIHIHWPLESQAGIDTIASEPEC